MSLRDEFQKIYDAHGALTPRLVVDIASDPVHPLHSHFEWDDAVAGPRWREAQASELIRRVRVVYREATDRHGESSVRAYHAVRDGEGYAYRSTDDVLADPFLTKLVLADMEREWKALKRRYGHFAEFAALVKRDVA